MLDLWGHKCESLEVKASLSVVVCCYCRAQFFLLLLSAKSERKNENESWKREKIDLTAAVFYCMELRVARDGNLIKNFCNFLLKCRSPASTSSSTHIAIIASPLRSCNNFSYIFLFCWTRVKVFIALTRCCQIALSFTYVDGFFPSIQISSKFLCLHAWQHELSLKWSTDGALMSLKWPANFLFLCCLFDDEEFQLSGGELCNF